MQKKDFFGKFRTTYFSLFHTLASMATPPPPLAFSVRPFAWHFFDQCPYGYPSVLKLYDRLRARTVVSLTSREFHEFVGVNGFLPERFPAAFKHYEPLCKRMLPFHQVDNSGARMITKDDIGAFLVFR
jgi:hypothetical protein